jgi:hypothetical protein
MIVAIDMLKNKNHSTMLKISHVVAHHAAIFSPCFAAAFPKQVSS